MTGIRTAVVTAVEGTWLRLRFAGEENPSGKRYLATCAASVGDRVVCVPADGAYIVIGVVGNTESGGGGSEGTGGGTSFSPGNALELKNGILNVLTTDEAEEDNTLPITSAGVNSIVGNIGALLDTI